MPSMDVFECIRCGRQVYHTENYCPHCGLDLYPEPLDEEEEELTSALGTRSPGWRNTVRGIVAALLAVPMLYLVLGPMASVLLVGGAVGVIGLLLAGRAIIRRTRDRRVIDPFDQER